MASPDRVSILSRLLADASSLKHWAQHDTYEIPAPLNVASQTLLRDDPALVQRLSLLDETDDIVKEIQSLLCQVQLRLKAHRNYILSTCTPINILTVEIMREIFTIGYEDALAHPLTGSYEGARAFALTVSHVASGWRR